jgi:hypothetical protein
MGGGKGGGSPDMSQMYALGDKSIKLNERMYEEGKQQMQPWYQTGVSAQNQLANLMGLTPSTTAASRQSLIDQYRPQFTTTGATTQTPSSNLYRTKDGRVGTPEDLLNYYVNKAPNRGNNSSSFGGINMFDLAGSKKQGQEAYDAVVRRAGFIPLQTSQNQSTTDTAGLNSYVDNLIAQQAAQAQQSPTFGSLLKNYTGQDIYEDPSYKFRLGEGQKAMERQLAASGRFLSPSGSKALMDYGQQMGSQEFGNAYNRYNQDQQNLFSRLATLSGYGQAGASSNIAGGQNLANVNSQIYSGMANSQIAAQQAAQANRGSMFNSLLGAGAQLGSAYLMSDKNIKENIKKVGEENGFNLYEFNYIGKPEKRFVGVMAQEVQEIMPDAVAEIGGYLAVDYGKIGLEMRDA